MSRKTKTGQGVKDRFLTTGEIDRLIVATAEAFAVQPRPVTEADLEAAVSWARQSQLGFAWVSLLLDGSLLPVRIEYGDEVAVIPVKGTMSKDAAKKHRTTLKALLGDWEWAPTPHVFLSNDDDLESVLLEPERAALKVAFHAGEFYQQGVNKLTEAQLMRWAGKCRNEMMQYLNILDGILLPIPRKGGFLSFHCVDELPVAMQEDYRRRLLGIGIAT